MHALTIVRHIAPYILAVENDTMYSHGVIAIKYGSYHLATIGSRWSRVALLCSGSPPRPVTPGMTLAYNVESHLPQELMPFPDNEVSTARRDRGAGQDRSLTGLAVETGGLAGCTQTVLC